MLFWIPTRIQAHMVIASQLHLYTLSVLHKATADSWENEKRAGGMTKCSGSDRLIFLIPCSVQHAPPRALAIPHAGPPLPHIDQNKKIKQVRGEQSQPAVHIWSTEDIRNLFWTCLVVHHAQHTLNFPTQLPEFMWKGNWSLFPFSWFSSLQKKYKVLQSNKMSTFPKAVLKWGYKQHCRKEGKTHMYK